MRKGNGKVEKKKRTDKKVEGTSQGMENRGEKSRYRGGKGKSKAYRQDESVVEARYSIEPKICIE